jgi:hypothetical protein
MELEHGIEVNEVSFDKFERRKVTRVYNFSKLEKKQIENVYGIEVRVETFDKFERRKPRSK